MSKAFAKILMDFCSHHLFNQLPPPCEIGVRIVSSTASGAGHAVTEDEELQVQMAMLQSFQEKRQLSLWLVAGLATSAAMPATASGSEGKDSFDL